MLGDFSRAPHALMKLKEQGTASEALIDALLNLLAARKEDPNAALPTAKAQQQHSGLKPAALKQQPEASTRLT